MIGAPGAIVFTDLVGFTEFTATQGDAEAVRLLAVQDAVVRSELPSDARVVKELGDGLLLWFATAPAAVTTGLALQGALESAGEAEGLPLWVRIAAHWGTPLRRGTDLVGHDVNVAARIVDVAAPGELLCSAAMVDAAGECDGISFVELGPVVMKGLPDAVPLFRAERVDAGLPVGHPGHA